LHKHLQRLAMANALKEKRDKVQDRDAELLRELSVCLNLDYYPL
jgi:hypothetical protein